ncbi:MAG TPA: hypothetical protein VGQ69_01080 [Gemmatimonadales bacterium]|nr:hypothetical protein [Gemmatimonadales bacterium]
MRAILLSCLAATGAAQARPPIRLVLEYSIDDAAGVSFGTINRLELGPDGSVAAVDGANGVIYRFTPAGRLRDSLGHRGQGPGEFQIAAGLGVGPGGEVALADLRTRRLTIWEPDGRLRGSTQLTGMPVDLLWRGADPVVGVVSFGDPVMIRFGIGRLGDNVISGELGGFPDPRIAEYPSAVSCGTCRHALTPAGKLLVAAPDTFYRVSELDAAGKPVRTWRRSEVGAGLRTPEELAALRRRLAAGPGDGRPLPGMEARFRAPDDEALKYRPRTQGIGIDSKGRLIALVSNSGRPWPVVDVFAGDGGFLGTVVPERPLETLVVRGTRVAALSETPEGIPTILVYRIEEVPPR